MPVKYCMGRLPLCGMILKEFTPTCPKIYQSPGITHLPERILRCLNALRLLLGLSLAQMAAKVLSWVCVIRSI